MRSLKKKIASIKRYLNVSNRAFPDFLIIGAQKCATTSLYYYLKQHSQVESGLGEKEPNFFEKHNHYGLRWYQSNFPVREPSKLYFEASTNYIFHPLVPERVARSFPHLKFILLIRNPVDRAFSHYHHQLRSRLETLSFEEAIETEPERLRGTEDLIIQKQLNYNYNHRNFSYLERGFYLKQIKNWHKYFDRRQFKIFSTEEFIQHPELITREMFDFLELPAEKIETKKAHNQGKHKEMISPETRKKIVEYFYPYNQELYEYLEQKFDWDH